MLPNVALIGGPGAGKDTVAQILFEEYGYTRYAFADPLRELASLNKLWQEDVNELGYEQAKREYPEVRQYLIDLGEGIRKYDPDYFVRAFKNHYRDTAGGYTVVTDVRKQIELRCVEQLGHRPMIILRDGVSFEGIEKLVYRNGPLVIENNGSIPDLKKKLIDLMDAADWALGSEMRGVEYVDGIDRTTTGTGV